MDTAFLGTPETSPEVQRLYDEDIEDVGYVMNASRLWAHHPAAQQTLFGLIGQAARAGGLTFRQRGILVTACASAMGDSYCSLAWGQKLAGESDAGACRRRCCAARTIGWTTPSGRSPAGPVRSPATPARPGRVDVQALRGVGYDDAQIFAITLFVALRIAFSSVNGALGARPDRELGESAPTAVRDAVAFGRPIGRGEG